MVMVVVVVVVIVVVVDGYGDGYGYGCGAGGGVKGETNVAELAYQICVTFGAICTPWSQQKNPPVIQVTKKPITLSSPTQGGPFYTEIHAMGT